MFGFVHEIFDTIKYLKLVHCLLRIRIDDFAIQLKAEKNLAAIRTFATAVDLEDPLVLKTQLMKRSVSVITDSC